MALLFTFLIAEATVALPYQVVHKKAGRVKCGAAVHFLIAETTVALTQVVHKKAGRVKCGAAVQLIAEVKAALASGSQKSWQGEMWRCCSPSDC